MANRRVPSLNELLSTQIADNDYFLISDISAIESKKIRADQLKSYNLSGTASYSLSALSASYATRSDTSSYAPCISASYALSSSYSLFAETASYVISASYALSSSHAITSSYSITASYALTSSVQLIVSSGYADYCGSASYLIYTPGFNNGTASYAISSSTSQLAKSSSYLIYAAGVGNGTASYAISSSNSISSSYLYYFGATNGTSSYSIVSENALQSNTASVASTVHSDKFYREFDIVTSSIINQTASFGWVQFTGSGATCKATLQAWGDVCVPISGGPSNLRFEISSSYGSFLLDSATFSNYLTGVTGTTASICGFFLQGQFTVSPSPQRLSSSLFAWNGLSFYTGSRGVKMLVKATTDYFVDE